MNDSPPDDLVRRLAAMEQENALLRQGMHQTTRMRALWEQAISELQATRHQLEVLQRLSSAVHQKLELAPLLETMMDAMEAALPAARGLPKGMFLIEDDRMRLAIARDACQEFSGAHHNLRTGTCLCGHAATTGELIFTRDCGADARPALNCGGHAPHGHLIVPLASQGKAVGVFFYYLPPGMEFDAQQRETFVAIGQQLGLALDHARLYEETRSLSLCDALTGLGNRRRMERALECELARVARYDRPLSVLLLDIDHFKHYNDTRGHLAGDQLLARIGGILESEKRENDQAVRYGGEEFLLILPETPLEGAQQMAERLRSHIAEQAGVTVSIGAAGATPGRRDRDSLLEAADRALYRAKQGGRDRVEVAPP